MICKSLPGYSSNVLINLEIQYLVECKVESLSCLALQAHRSARRDILTHLCKWKLLPISTTRLTHHPQPSQNSENNDFQESWLCRDFVTLWCCWPEWEFNKWVSVFNILLINDGLVQSLVRLPNHLLSKASEAMNLTNAPVQPPILHHHIKNSCRS